MTIAAEYNSMAGGGSAVVSMEAQPPGSLVQKFQYTLCIRNNQGTDDGHKMLSQYHALLLKYTRKGVVFGFTATD